MSYFTHGGCQMNQSLLFPEDQCIEENSNHSPRVDKELNEMIGF